jgi:hypothetical protein
MTRQAAACRLATILGGVLVTVVGLGLLHLRQSGGLLTSPLWAEDGGAFLPAAWRAGLLATWDEPYAGYIHLVPRAIAAIVAALPLTWAAGAIAVSASLVMVGCAAVVSRNSAVLLQTRSARWCAGLVVLFLPVAAVEAIGNLANLHWWLMIAATVVLAAPARHAVDRLIGVIVVCAAALSDPLTGLCLLAGAWRLVDLRNSRGRTWRDHLVMPAALICLAVQALSYQSGQRTYGGFSRRDLTEVMAARAAAVFLGPSTSERVLATFGLTALLGTALVVAVAVAKLCCGQAVDRRRSSAAWALAAVAVAHLLVPTVLAWESIVSATGSVELWYGGRYLVVPHTLGLLLVVRAVEILSLRLPTDLTPTRRFTTTAGLATLLLVVTAGMAVDFRAENGRRDGPKWSEVAKTGALTCRSLGPSAVVEVPISPAGWMSPVPCSSPAVARAVSSSTREGTTP